MKRLIYVIAACILLSILVHAQRPPRWFETNYFATAAIYDADSVTFDKFIVTYDKSINSLKKVKIALRSPAITRGDSIWTFFCLVFKLNIEKHDFDIEPRLETNFSYQKLPGSKAAPLDSTQTEAIAQELRRIFSKDIILRNTTMDNLYKIYEEFYINSFKTDSIQSKKIVFAYYIAMLMVPPAEKATETQTGMKQ